MLEVNGLTKRYGNFYAIKDLNFSIDEGEIVGFLGPNGAGKSTTMNIVTGYLSSTSGTVKVDGYEILESPFDVKKKIGYLPEIPPIYNEMTVKAYLSFVYDLKKLKLDKKKHIDEICELVKIDGMLNKIIRNLSKGYKQRVGIAQALLGNPPLLILDEPTVGLDPKQIIEIRNLIKKLGEDHTIILSSHILSEIQATCDRVIIINQGKICVDEKMDELESKMSQENKFVFKVDGDQSKVCDIIKCADCVKNVEPTENDEFVVEFTDGVVGRKNVFKELAKNDLPILMLKDASMSLEDMFIKIISEHNEDFVPNFTDEEDVESEHDENVPEQEESPAEDDSVDNEGGKE